MLRELKCKVCGKKFEQEVKRGRVSFYCSDECRKKDRYATNNSKMVERYHSDDEFRERRVKQNTESNRRRREARKEQVMQELVDDIMQAGNATKVRKILEERVRIKSEFYNAKSL